MTGTLAEAATGSNRLPTLAGEIEVAHRRCKAGVRDALEAALAAGRALLETRELVPHGQWQDWLRANVPGVSIRTAQRYIRATAKAGKNDMVSFFTLRELIHPARRLDPAQALAAMSVLELVAWGIASLDRAAAAIKEGDAARSPEKAVRAYRRAVAAALAAVMAATELRDRAERELAELLQREAAA